MGAYSRDAICSSIPDNAHLGAPILTCVSKGVPGIFMDVHMMVAQPEKACTRPFLPSVALSIR